MTLSRNDSNELKKLDPVATAFANTFMLATRDVIRDMNANSLEEIVDNFGLKTSYFTPDTSSPELEWFDLNLSTEILTLYFSETVRVSTLDIRRFVLQGNVTAVINHTFSLATVLTENAPLVRLLLSKQDLNAIKKLRTLAASHNDTFLAFSLDAIRDMNNNRIEPRLSGKQVRRFTEDTVPPRLESFVLDLNSGELLLTFTETVRASTFDPTSANLRTEPKLAVANERQLTGGNHTRIDGTTLILDLLPDDLNFIKTWTRLASSVETTIHVFSSQGYERQCGCSA